MTCSKTYIQFDPFSDLGGNHFLRLNDLLHKQYFICITQKFIVA